MKIRLLTLAGCLIAPSLSHSNDFPTQARVEYVLQCMELHGGQSYDTLYPCVCSVDKIAAEMSHAEYVEAATYSQMIKTPGERGGLFREMPGTRKLVKRFTRLKEKVETACFAKHIRATP
jgi:hypothetical protein